jgi:NAD(P)-dependent dehydrogenase (short-subunit alcohol dehydrogenase family)
MNILITGSSGLIGSALVKDLLSRGENLILCDIKKYKVNKNANQKYKNQIYFQSTNINNSKSIDLLIKKAVKKFGKIDAAIHCAYPKSKNFGQRFENLSSKELEYNLTTQLGSAIIFSQKIVKFFLKQGYGNLILFSSIMGVKNPDFEVYKGTSMSSPIEYSAIKSGIISITKYLAKYLKNKKIKVNCISPGGILNNQNKIFIKKYKKKCLSKGLLDPNDLCGLVRFLLSSDSNYINGSNHVIDDGWSL